jgi:hypothetical protein
VRARYGFTLVEAMVSATLGTLLLGTLAATLIVHERLARSQAEHLARADALRTHAVILRAELRMIDPGEDLRAVSTDSLALRTFRGLGVVCTSANDTLVTAYRGLREPDPAKDSILLLGEAVSGVYPLLNVDPGPGEPSCPLTAAARTLRFRIPGPAPRAALALVFESGTYFVSANAFRYRRGTEGRQPLTPEWLDNASAFRTIRAAGDSTLRGVAIDLRGRRSTFQSPLTPGDMALPTSFLNAQPNPRAARP